MMADPTGDSTEAAQRLDLDRRLSFDSVVR